MVRRVIRNNHPELHSLLPYIKGNVGFVFTNSDLGEVRNQLLAQRVAAPAKAGAISPIDVVIPKGDTGLEPTQTAFLQALNIATKINKGQIQIINDKQILTAGDKVGSSEATLLQKLNIKPFSYGLSVQVIYDEGFIYKPDVLDITPSDVLAKFSDGVSKLAQLSLQIGYPTLASIPHSFARAFKNVLAIAVATDYTFKQAEEIKNILENPEAFAAAAAASVVNEAPKAADASKESKAAEKEKSDEEESEGDRGFGLFD
jgi:large subunit ribosomal protein LP0